MFDFHQNFKNRKIKIRSKIDIEPQELFLDQLSQRNEKELFSSQKKIEPPIKKNKLLFIYIFFFFIILMLFARTFQFQVIDKEKFSAKAEENKFIIHHLKAERGVIYDQFGKQLVWNLPSFDLIVDKRKFPKEESKKVKTIKQISEILGKDYKDLKKTIEESDLQEVLIFKNLPHKKLVLLEVKISQNEFPGFRIEKNLIRDYKDGSTFASLIGYTGLIKSKELKNNSESYSVSDFVGRDGLEKSYEEVLRKNPGKLQIERDALGNEISRKIIFLPKSGDSLVLWLDSDLQKKIKEELSKVLNSIGAKKGTVIALDPKTGGILGFVNIPSFDNNLFNKNTNLEDLQSVLMDPEQPLFNRAISGRYPTGSTIKPLIAAAALEEGIITPKKRIYDPGFIEVPNKYNPDIVYRFNDWKVHNSVDMRKAIAQSCNVYFYTIGGGYKDQEGLGPTRIKKYLELFGWGVKTGIDLPGEADGFLPSPKWKQEVKNEGWWDGDTYHFSIGQGDILVTPLQVTTAIASIASNGKLLKPKVVKKIINESSEKELSVEIIRENFISPENLEVVRQGMRQAVTSGSSIILNSLPVKAAAKTGTAQISRENFYDNWVSVFAPYDNPEIVLTVLIEDVKGVQSATLPVASGILKWYFSDR